MALRIPSSFSLMNRDYRVEHATPEEQDLMDDISGDGDRLLGLCDYEDARIILGKHRNREAFEHTYFHELAHALLMAIGLPNLAKDEDKVDALGGALHHYEKSKQGTLPMRERKNVKKVRETAIADPRKGKKAGGDKTRRRDQRLADHWHLPIGKE